jgi:cardiolipin synthase
MAERPGSSHLTIPNLITLFRILLTPLFLIFLLQKNYPRALIVFMVAGLSDMADGLVARAWKQKSPLGAFLDPMADKLLMATSFVALGIFRLIPPWLAVVVISRDVILTVGTIILKLADAPLVIRPSLAGKLTTTLQIATVFFVLLGKIWPLPALFLTGLFWATAILTAMTGVHYMSQGLQMMNAAPGNKRQGNDHG